MSGTVPVGMISAILCSASAPPSGWLWCDGSTFDGNQYPELAQLLSNNTLPDLRDRTLVGAGGSYAQEQTFGAITVTLSIDQMPAHQHYGWGEHQSDTNNGLGFGRSVNVGFTGSKSTDTDNNLFGSSWAGGVGLGDQGIAIVYPDGTTGYTWQGATANNPVDIRQPSCAINYFIYAGTAYAAVEG